MCTSAVFDTSSELWLVGMRTDLVIAVSAVVVFDVGASVLTDEKIIVADIMVIGLGFIITASYAVTVLAGVWSSAIGGGAPSIGTGVNGSDSTAVMTAVELTSPALLEGAFLCF